MKGVGNMQSKKNMSNRRGFNSGNYGGSNSGTSGGSGGGGGGGGGGSGYNQGSRGNFNLGSGLSGVNPWQSGSSPGRSGLAGNNAVPSLLATNNLLNQLTTDSQLAIATKLLSSILPVQQTIQQPPSLMSLNNTYGSSVRFGGGGGGGGGGFGGDRFRRSDKRNDNFRNRRQANDRNKDRKGGDNKARADKTKTKTNEKDKGKNEDEDDNDDERKEDDEKGERHEGDTRKEGRDNQPEGPIPEYENIPVKLFNCHVCGKNMWNDVSFDTHVKGRNHRNKLRELEDNYQMQTNLMRQIASMSLKLEELRRGGKRRPYPEQYCKMCDLHFDGMTMFAHRSTTEHQNLKKFIHPTCEMCKIDFQVRIEFDEHMLTPQHLQQETKALLRKEKFEKDPFYVKLREKEIKMTSLSETTNDVKGKGDVVLTAEDKAIIKGLLGDNEALPEYDPDAEALIAEHFVVPQSGYFCKVCKVFLLSSEFVDVHCRTVTHYKNYVEMLKLEATKSQTGADDSAEGENEKRKSDSNEDNGGNWKRRKVDNKNELNGGKKYDPDETLDDTMEDYTSEPSAGSGVVKMETTDTDEDKVQEEQIKPSKPTTRRSRGRAGRK